MLATVLTGCSLQADPSKPGESPDGAKPGQKAPDFSMPSLNGKGNISLQDYKGKPVVLNFWASWCGPCREEQPRLQAVYDQYKDQGVVFIGANIRDPDESAAKAYLEEFGVSYPAFYDPTSKTAFLYKVQAIPTTVFIGKDGKIVERVLGGLTEPSLVLGIEKAMGKASQDQKLKTTGDTSEL